MDTNPAALLQRRPIADDLFELTFEVPGGQFATTWRVPGQYVRVFLPDQNPLFLAMATPPGSSTLQFVVRATGGASSALCALDVGAEAQMSVAEGRGFPIERARGFTPLLFATGTGIGPLRAVIETEGWRDRPAKLYYGVLSPDRLVYAERFAAWEAAGVSVIPVVSHPEGDAWRGELGFVQDAYIRAPMGDPAACVALLCGVRGMVEALTTMLSAAGMPREQILLNF